jgi:hypothetical protein
MVWHYTNFGVVTIFSNKSIMTFFVVLIRLAVMACNSSLLEFNYIILSVIWGFRCQVAENCALPGHYAASSVNFLTKFRDKLSVPKRR